MFDAAPSSRRIIFTESQRRFLEKEKERDERRKQLKLQRQKEQDLRASYPESLMESDDYDEVFRSRVKVVDDRQSPSPSPSTSSSPVNKMHISTASDAAPTTPSAGASSSSSNPTITTSRPTAYKTPLNTNRTLNKTKSMPSTRSSDRQSTTAATTTPPAITMSKLPLPAAATSQQQITPRSTAGTSDSISENSVARWILEGFDMARRSAELKRETANRDLEEKYERVQRMLDLQDLAFDGFSDPSVFENSPMAKPSYLQMMKANSKASAASIRSSTSPTFGRTATNTTTSSSPSSQQAYTRSSIERDVPDNYSTKISPPRSTTSATLPSSTTTTNHQAGFEERTAANGRVSDLDSYVARTNQLLKFTTKSANNNVDDRHFHHQQQQQEQQPFFITTSTAPTASAAKKRAMRHSYEAQSYAKLSSPEGLYQQSILASARPASASPRSKQFSYAAGPAAVTLPLNSNNYIGGGSIGGVKSSQQQLPTNQLLHSTSEMFYLDRDEEKNLQSYKAELAIIKLNKKVDEMAEEIEKLKDVLHGYMVAEEQTYLPKIIKIQAIARGYIVRKKLREYNVFSWHHKKLRCVKDSVFTWDDLLHDCRIISGTRAAFDTVFGDGIVRIQALMRGALVRRRIKAFWNLNSSSNKIQRLWKGYKTRKEVGEVLNYHILRQINTKQSKFISNLQKTVGSLESRVSELEAKLILKSEFQELHLKITTLLAQHGIRHKEDAVEVDEEGSSGLDIVKQYSKRTESFDMLAE